MRIQPKKRLGQNFLIDQNIQRKIIRELDLLPSDIVLEIGPGRGRLTSLIAPQVEKVYAIEVDKRLCLILNQRFKDTPDVSIINQDILKFDLTYLKLKPKIKVFGNIPYYISSPIIEHLIKYRGRVSTAFLTVQKEFAQRIVAAPGTKNFSSFSCFVQYYIKAKVLFDISKNCFKPAPKVDSSFIRLDIRDHPVIRTAFNQRRKTLRNSLAGSVSKETLDSFFNKLNIDKNSRPEALSLKDFAVLTDLSENI
ncbi:MAG: 16S rRNA (adenine(1518)-N(6)/adenine(1519)-N(6))-dimethyltransferase RsmA [Candidatus Omnitrophica bacterium]|nr:16S rRNA (adenine(1518)-N(6)/adenine(1519)-N(6))-dimethyltransferase RsmA [Candidatus Omnitrophota bacterium]